MRTCSGDGTGWGACEAQALPAAETCAAPEDENCDGFDCALWSKSFGSAGAAQIPLGVAVDAQGNILLAGTFAGTISFGASLLISSGGKDYFLAKLSTNGEPIWAISFGDAVDNGDAIDIATDPSGDITIAGELRGSIDIDQTSLMSSAGTDIFVARLDGDGHHLWSHTFGNGATQRPKAITFSQGNVIVAGDFIGTLDFGGSPLTSADYDIFVVSFDPDSGVHEWSSQFGESSGQQTSEQQASAIAGDAAGNIALIGRFNTSIGFGAASTTHSGYAGFVGKLDKNGQPAWLRKLTSCEPHGLAVDTMGGLLVTGEFTGSANLGGGIVESHGFADVFLARYNTGGGHVWSARFGEENRDVGTAAAFDAQGNVLLAGVTHGNIDFGGGVSEGEPNEGQLIFEDMFTAKLDDVGTHLWSKRFGDKQRQIVHALAIDPTSNGVFVIGSNNGVIDFGDGPRSTSGNLGIDVDAVIAKIAP